MIYIIYKMCIQDFVYIGSSKDFNQRKIAHKRNCNSPQLKEYKFKVYEIIRNNGGWENVTITPIEEFDCETKLQATIREEYWRNEYKANMNTFKAYREGKEKENESKREKLVCDCGITYSKSNSTHHKRSKIHIDFETKKKQEADAAELLKLQSCICAYCGK